ncbi:serine hydrolase domain-containing protein [Paucibacter sp. DJ2R-2]|uniref:serine hydrolase domain-containing protein n=1 Tax=Paucibacter sp. DJ2R-2 TaxID=2893558 RepID=UPI0021E36215|nr:serine hydrolase domain-containing protein [Paucibacter sp. DJ2R-2]MCV2419076.1 beta-lactamase family protein [Paucibacter sp. DJ4R-1]MCV2437969.1 beta-lactamase family protein [Paucibacter sp. DJ2R-2]
MNPQPFSPHRRHLLLAGLAALGGSACASRDLRSFRGQDLAQLAAQQSICLAAIVTLKGGQAQSPRLLRGGCTAPAHATDSADGPPPLFQAASLTKPVVAYLALQLVREGRLDLDAPLSRYLPQGYSRKPAAAGAEAELSAATLARIPLRCLLNHSSGLPNWGSSWGPLRQDFEAGQRWQYSGEGYVLLQAVLSAVSGQDFEALMQARVFEPLGMRDSRLRMSPADGELRARLVPGHAWMGGLVDPIEFKRANAAASLITSAPDYARLMSAWLRDPALLALLLDRAVSVAPDLSLSWGQGWGLEQAEGGPYLWQWGNNPGYRAFAMASVHSGDGFVLLSNNERGLALAAALGSELLPKARGVWGFGGLD